MPSNAPISMDNFPIVGKPSVSIPTQMSSMAISSSQQSAGSLWNNEYSNGGNKLWSNGKTLKPSDDCYDTLVNGIRERELLNLLDDNEN